MTAIQRVTSHLRWFPLHLWRRYKWGGDSDLDCRRCRICGRFEVWFIFGWVERDELRFGDVRPA